MSICPDQRLQRRRRTAIGHHRRGNAERFFQIGTADVRGAATAGRADQDRGRPRLDPGNQFLKRPGRYLALAENQLRIAGIHRDRFEVLQHIILQRVDGAVDDVRTDMPDAERIAIRRRANHAADGDTSRRARRVLNDDALSQRRGHALPQNAGDRVGRSARGKGHHQRDRPRRKRLCECAGSGQRQDAGHNEKE